jgi:hypothetical protein
MRYENARSIRVDIAVRQTVRTAPQFARAGIVEDLARRLTRTFAQNLEEEPAGRAGARERGGSASLNMSSVQVSLWSDQLRTWIARQADHEPVGR